MGFRGKMDDKTGCKASYHNLEHENNLGLLFENHV